MQPCLGPAEGAAAPTLAGVGGRGIQVSSKAPPTHPQEIHRCRDYAATGETTNNAGPLLSSRKKTPKSQTHPGVTSPDPQLEWGTFLH